IDYGYYTLTPNGGQDWAARPSPNLLAWTEEFAAGWVAGAATLASNVAVAPDGTMTADKLVESATTDQHLVGQSTGTVTIGQTWTLSIFARAAERGAIALTAFGEAYAVFNLLTGAVTATGGFSCSITPYGDGWYRCAVTIPRTNTNGTWYCILWNLAGNNVYAGDGVSGVYLWGAKVERGAATGYVPVTPACRGVLIEDSRTNVMRASGAIHGAPWANSAGASGHTATATGTAPDGVGQWALITAGSAGGDWRQGAASTLAGGGAVTASLFVQRGNQPYARFQLHLLGGATTGRAVSYNFDTGQVTADPGVTVATQLLPGGVVRVAATFVDDGDTGAVTPYLLLHSDSAVGETTLYWGAQVEAGAFPTSYIPTTGAAVMRGGDNINMPLQQYFNPTAWTIAIEGDVFGVVTAADQYFLEIDNGTYSERAFLRGVFGSIQAGVVSAGTQVVGNGHGTLAVNVTYRLALAMAPDDAASSLNGAAPVANRAGLNLP
ncbi:phage head spike fiber domain-containing protein, partial [Azospirillum brasilense]|uniref:phage head spike fiber domain-containing protein n=1 Tax=Azospirillum brasilense TaxID=192 RepID=UPI003D7E8FCA